MKKFKLFINNFLVYGLGGIISKIIPLIMVPIVTRLMPSTKYYGISDMANTVVSFGSALAIMGMYDAMFRLFFEKDEEEYKKDICSTALVFTMMTSVIVFVVLLLIKEFIASKFLGDLQYEYVVYIIAIATLVGATNSIVSAPTRMQNKRGIFLISNTISPIISYGVSIPLLLKGYYVIALPLAGAISAITMEVTFGILNCKWFQLKRFNVTYLKQLLVIAVPLLPNFIIYWVFNSSDRLMITNILGVEATGIYSVGSKLGHTSQLIYTAFANGWQYFAFSTMKDKDQVKSNSLVFEYLGIISFVATSYICAWSFLIYKVLFTESYLSGYIIAPYLFLAPLLQMLFQVACNQFLVIKKTWPNMFILLLGAVVNVFLNIILIPKLGIEGAAVATLIGYIISDLICVIVLVRMKLMIISKRFSFSCLIMGGYIILWRCLFYDNFVVGTFVAIVLTVALGGLYMRDILPLLKANKKDV